MASIFRPYAFFPFPVFIPLGFIQTLPSIRYISIALILVAINFATIIQLYVYRYSVVCGCSRIPKIYYAILWLMYVASVGLGSFVDIMIGGENIIMEYHTVCLRSALSLGIKDFFLTH